MIEKEIKEFMVLKDYELQYYNGDKTIFCFIKYLNDEKCVVDLSESTFAISCEVNIDGKFNLSYVTNKWMFGLKSSDMSPINRNDFDKIESEFIRYSYSLHKADN